MDNRVKERLTGALILVAAGVILVPEIFSGKPHTEIDTDAPPAAPASEGPPLRSYTADLVSSESAPAEPAAGPAPPAPVVTAPPPAPTTSPPAATPGTAAPKPPAAPPPPSSPPTSPTLRPASPPPSTTAGTPSAPARGGWYVQVGGFSQAANAERLASQLRSQGFGVSVVQPSGGNKLTRVRVGPAPDRTAAVELQQRLKSSGHAGSLVAP